MKKLENWQEWQEKFKPIPHHIDKKGTYFADQNGVNYSFETYGKELDYIQKQKHEYIWTLGEQDGVQYITNGKWLVNRLAYFVCKNPCYEERGSTEYTYQVFDEENE